MITIFDLNPKKIGKTRFSVEMPDEMIANLSKDDKALAIKNMKNRGTGTAVFVLSPSRKDTVNFISDGISNLNVRNVKSFYVPAMYNFSYKGKVNKWRLTRSEVNPDFKDIRSRSQVDNVGISSSVVSGKNVFVDLSEYNRVMSDKAIKNKKELSTYGEIILSRIESPEFDKYHNKVLLIPVQYFKVSNKDLKDYTNTDALSVILSLLLFDPAILVKKNIDLLLVGDGGVLNFDLRTFSGSTWNSVKSLYINNINKISKEKLTEDEIIANKKEEMKADLKETELEQLGIDSDNEESEKFEEIQNEDDPLIKGAKHLAYLHELKEKAVDMRMRTMSTAAQKRYSQITDKITDPEELKEQIKDIKVDVKKYENIECLDEAFKESTYSSFSDKYNKVFKHKDELDILKSFSSNKEFPLYVTSYKKKDVSTNTDLMEEHNIQFRDPDGKTHNISLLSPDINQGVLYLNDTKKILLNQVLANPVTKPKPDEVMIATSYNKAWLKRYNDKVTPLIDMIIKGCKTEGVKVKVKMGNGLDPKTEGAPISYTGLAKEIISISKGRNNIICFNESLINEKIIAALPKLKPLDDTELLPFALLKKEDHWEVHYINLENDSVVIGTGNPNDSILTMREFEDKIDAHLLDVINDLDTTLSDAINKKSPGKRLAYTTMKILRREVPLGIILLYLIGLIDLLERMEAKFRISDKKPYTVEFKDSAGEGEYISKKPKIKKASEGLLELKDCYVIFERRDEIALLMNGVMNLDLTHLTLEQVSIDRGELAVMMSDYIGDTNYPLYLENYDELLVDPISAGVLEDNNIPSEFSALLIYCNSLLANNSSVDDISLDTSRIRREEVASAMLYKVLADSYAAYRVKKRRKTHDPKMVVTKDAVIKGIQELPTLSELTSLSPIQVAEEKRAFSTKGFGGVNLEQAHTKWKRSFHKTFMGVVAQPSPYSAGMGVVRSLSVNPNITSMRGNFKVCHSDEEVNALPGSSIVGISEAMIPLSSEHDMSLRNAMALSQTKHRRPVAGSTPLLVSYGYDEVVGKDMDGTFNAVAKQDGTILSVKNDVMVVQYTDGSRDAFNLKNLQKDPEKSFYTSNILTPKPGMKKFKAGDILAYNENFYKLQPDGKVLYSSGILANVALASDMNVYEDSGLITTKLSAKGKSGITKIKKAVMDDSTVITESVNVGDTITAGEPLMTFTEYTNDPTVDNYLEKILSNGKESLSEFQTQTINAPYTGTIIEIKVYYTRELETYHKSVQEFIKNIHSSKSSKARLLETNASDRKYALMESDNTGVSKPYKNKINGTIVNPDLNQFMVEYYIEYRNNIGVGDKITAYSALKNIITKVVDDDITTERGDEVSMIFSQLSLEMRGVTSLKLVGPVNKALIRLKKDMRTMMDDNMNDIKKYLK